MCGFVKNSQRACAGATMLWAPSLSVVVPVYNEQDNLRPLTTELMSVLRTLDRAWEIILVDDGSTDTSPQVLAWLAARHDHVRVARLKKNFGQTAAFAAGFDLARGDVIITMDADLQNDPHDIPCLLARIGQYDLVCGRRRCRRDNIVRKVSSRIANAVRNALSGETVSDVGCSLKAFRRETVRQLPLFDGMHRFFPTLVKMAGGRVLEIDVNHRPRMHGEAKYNIRNRAVRSFIDLLAVCWMQKRRLVFEIEALTTSDAGTGRPVPVSRSRERVIRTAGCERR